MPRKLSMMRGGAKVTDLNPNSVKFISDNFKPFVPKWGIVGRIRDNVISDANLTSPIDGESINTRNASPNEVAKIFADIIDANLLDEGPRDITGTIAYKMGVLGIAPYIVRSSRVPSNTMIKFIDATSKEAKVGIPVLDHIDAITLNLYNAGFNRFNTERVAELVPIDIAGPSSSQPEHEQREPGEPYDMDDDVQTPLSITMSPEQEERAAKAKLPKLDVFGDMIGIIHPDIAQMELDKKVMNSEITPEIHSAYKTLVDRYKMGRNMKTGKINQKIIPKSTPTISG